MMSRFSKPFRGLRWKLTLSYTVVTVATLLVVEMLLILGVGFIVINSNILPNLMITVVETFITPNIAGFLDRSEPDIDALTEWLDFAYSEGVSFQSSQTPNLRLELGDLDRGATLIVLDRNLDFLISRPELDDLEDSEFYLDAAEKVKTAANSEKVVGSTSRKADGKLITTVPVANEGGHVLGAVMMFIAYPPRGSIMDLLSLIGVSLIAITIPTGILGTLFGYITARSLTRRLRNVSDAADSWSEGNFDIFIQDRSEDELGDLAHQLNRMAEQLQNLLRIQQELASLEERNRLARDLHDSVKQQVFATTMQIGAAQATLERDPEVALEHLEQAETLARQAQAELTAILLELRPRTLRGKGLLQALKEYIEDWSRLNKIAAQIAVQGECELSLVIEQTLFRVAQEGLSNVARHSQATQVEIQVICNQDKVSLTIEDNGVGFEPSSAEGRGIGLRSMRERMQALGGNLILDSTQGEGARLTASCQIQKGNNQNG